MGWACGMCGDIRNAYDIFVEKSRRSKPLSRLTCKGKVVRLIN
jgi:hypothetical protein